MSSDASSGRTLAGQTPSLRGAARTRPWARRSPSVSAPRATACGSPACTPRCGSPGLSTTVRREPAGLLPPSAAYGRSATTGQPVGLDPDAAAESSACAGDMMEAVRGLMPFAGRSVRMRRGGAVRAAARRGRGLGPGARGRQGAGAVAAESAGGRDVGGRDPAGRGGGACRESPAGRDGGRSWGVGAVGGGVSRSVGTAERPLIAFPQIRGRSILWRRQDSNLGRLSRRIYSPLPLATRAHRLGYRLGGPALRRYSLATT